MERNSVNPTNGKFA